MNRPDAKEAIVIFGAGDFGRQALFHYSDQYRVVAFVDNDPNKRGSWIEGRRVHSPADLPQLRWDRLFVASSHAPEILCELESRYQLAPDRVFEVPISLLHAQTANAGMLAARLHHLVTHLDRLSIPYWLDHSSLLGLLRDDDPCAVDIDLAIFPDHLPALRPMLDSCYPAHATVVRRYGFSHDLWGPEDIQQIKLFGSIDFHVKIRSAHFAFWLVGPRLLQADERFYDGCESQVWQNTVLRLPKQPAEYLAQLYGAWKQPAHHWTYADYANVAHVFDLSEMQGEPT